MTSPGITFVNELASNGGSTYSLNVQTLMVITSLAFLPGLMLLMTSFTRIIIVLSVLRQALGLQTTPPNMVLAALAMALTVFVMRGVITQEQNNALNPYLDHCRRAARTKLHAGTNPQRPHAPFRRFKWWPLRHP